MVLNKTFTGTITKGGEGGSWTYIAWDESSAFFGTSRPVKVVASIEGHEFQATFLSLGNGVHMLPLRASVVGAINKQPGDKVEVRLLERL